jgi:hypothetical protein
MVDRCRKSYGSGSLVSRRLFVRRNFSTGLRLFKRRVDVVPLSLQNHFALTTASDEHNCYDPGKNPRGAKAGRSV